MSSLLVVDTETGGTDPGTHSILSLAGVVFTDGAITEQFEILIVESVLSVTSNALQVNRIDLREHSARGVSPHRAVGELKEFLIDHFAAELRSGEKVTLAGHNINFDIGFMRRLFRLADASFEELFSYRVLDTVSVLRYLALAGLVPPHCVAADAAFAHFGITVPEGERHTALGDAKATALLLEKLIRIARPFSNELVHNAAA
jgi:DNA polymerase III subunit epsilon